ncbi:MAG: hypothetical protein R2865_06390 [Deinococcales bacterium]
MRQLWWSRGVKLRSLIIVIIVLGLFGLALGRKVEISTDPNDETSRLELRNLTLPDGTKATLYIIQGSPITIKIDEDTVIADSIEFDPESQLLRIIGKGKFESAEETVEGENFTVDLSDNSFDALEVVISTGKIDVKGASATRFPGQLDVRNGAFSLCGRCEQEIEDYGFRAESMQLYPGDRLIGYNVTVLVRDLPIFFTPFLVLPLGPEDKQPQLEIKSGNNSEKATATLAWPYVAGPDQYGRVTLNYYADIASDQGNFLSNRLLGGDPKVSYVGLNILHNFFIPSGKGKLEFGYVPSFINYSSAQAIGKTRDQIRFKVEYQSFNYNDSTLDESSFAGDKVDDFGDDVNDDLGPDEDTSQDDLASSDEDTADGVANDGDLADTTASFRVSEPQVYVVVERLDDRRQRMAEYKLDLRQRLFNLGLIQRADVSFFSQGYIDLDDSDEVKQPSYASFSTPEFSYSQWRVEGLEPQFTLGPLNLSDLILEIGLFEDESNRDNRSAAKLAIIRAGPFADRSHLKR